MPKTSYGYVLTPIILVQNYYATICHRSLSKDMNSVNVSVTLCQIKSLGGFMNYYTVKPRESAESKMPEEHKKAPETIVVSDTLPRVFSNFRSRWCISSEQKSDEEIFALWMEEKLGTCRGNEAETLRKICLDQIVADIFPYRENKGLTLQKSAAKIAYEILINAYGREKNIRDFSQCIVALFAHDFCLSEAEEIILDMTFLEQVALFRKKYEGLYPNFRDTEILIYWMKASLKRAKDKRAKVLLTVPIAELRQNIIQNESMCEIRLRNISALALHVIIGERYDETMSEYEYSQYVAWLFEESFQLYSNPETD